MSQNDISQALNNPNYGPILKLVKKMINYKPTDRPTLSEVQTDLKSFHPIPRISASILNLPLPMMTLTNNQTLQLSYELQELSIAQKTVNKSAFEHQSPGL